jgi:predicted ATPase/transcriptional regulator with XRE-family HTH domain
MDRGGEILGTRKNNSDIPHDDDEPPATSFAAVLREHRLASRLTQEKLAERADLGRRGIQDLERGLHRPHRQTVQLLVRALALTGESRYRFELLANAEVRPGTLDRHGRGLSRKVSRLREWEQYPSSRPPPEFLGQFAPRFPLPHPVTSFVGREAEIDDLTRLLSTRRTLPRLVTLTGPGGAGKTRIALEATRRLRNEFADGICFVPLASSVGPGDVGSAIARALRVLEPAGLLPTERLVDFIGDQQILLVLDNFEHVLGAVNLIHALLTACPGLKVLATSRVVLRSSGEEELAIRPLTLPEPTESPTVEHFETSEAVRLFVDRAKAVRPGFSLTSANAATVGAICQRLDGLPLAIELAAPHLRTLSSPALLARLAHRLAFLTGGSRDLPERQQTLRQTISWSYDLLSDGEQVLFRRLSIFAAEFGLEAAEAIGGPKHQLGFDVFAGLDGLVSNSLIQAVGTTDEPRFAMLPSTREFGIARLEEHGESNATQERHSTYFLTFAESLSPLGNDGYDPSIVTKLEREREEIRAALLWFDERGAVESGLRLLMATFWLWYVLGPQSEGRIWIDRFLNLQALQPVSPVVLRCAVYLAGRLAMLAGDQSAAIALQTKALELGRSAGDTQVITDSLASIGWLLLDQGDVLAARAILDEAIQLTQQSNLPNLVSRVLIIVGDEARVVGDFRTARLRYEESLAIRGSFYDFWSLRNLGLTVLEEGDLEHASSLIRKALLLCQDKRDELGMIEAMAALAAVSATGGDAARASRLLGAVEAGLKRIGGRLYFGDRLSHDQTMRAVSLSLTSEELATCWTTGQALTLEQAVSYALEM